MGESVPENAKMMVCKQNLQTITLGGTIVCYGEQKNILVISVGISCADVLRGGVESALE